MTASSRLASARWGCSDRVVAIALLLALTLASTAMGGSLRLTVGDDAACDFRTSALPNALQAAIDALADASSPAGPATIVVARSGDYDGIQGVVEGFGGRRSLAVRGGYADCAATTGDGQPTRIDAGGTTTGPLLDIQLPVSARGSAVNISDLLLTGSTGGPGMRVHGAQVELTGVHVVENSSPTDGGGIDVSGAGSRLRTSGGSVSGNVTGGDGGGISCTAGAVVEIAADTAITGNHAQGSGGGVHADGCSGRIDAGSPDSAGLPAALGFNTAGSNGGGLAAASGLGPTELVLGTSTGGNSSSASIVGNFATDGGGLHAAGPQTRLLLRNARVLDNTAVQRGGGMAAADGARIEMRTAQRRCPHGEMCAQLAGNSATVGGAVALAGSATIELTGVDIVGNAASAAASVAGIEGSVSVPTTRLQIVNSFLRGNSGAPSLIELSAGTSLHVLQSTVIGDPALDSILRLGSGSQLLLGRTIVSAAASVPVVQMTASAVIEVDCSLVHEAASLAAVLDLQSVVFDSPGFVDPAAGDFRLRADAEAGDRCAFDARYLPRDFQLEPRPQRAALPQAFGPYDIGADEWSPTLFRDGLEG